MRLGTTISFADPMLVELVAGAFDFVWLDLEHGSLSERDVQTLAMAAQGAGSSALVRLPATSYARLGAVLDAGVDGVVAPMVESASQVEELLRRLRYPPRGTRGFAPRRAMSYGRRPPTLDQALELIVQIETPAGVGQAATIAGLDGVSVLFVGTADLARTSADPEYVDRGVDAVREAAIAAGKSWGLALPPDASPEDARDARLVLLGSDVTLIAAGVDRAVARLREPDREQRLA